MKRIALAGLIAALLAPAARAEPDGDDDNFWASMVAPHAEEIELILGHARKLRAESVQYTAPPDWGYANPYAETQREQKRRRIADAYGMLRYAARELDPNHVEVLYELGRAADDIERYDHARGALERFLDRAEADDHRRPEAHIRLGRIDARRDDWSAAIGHFRAALGGTGTALHGQALIDLGCAYMHEARMAEAIDAFDQAANASPYGQQYYVAQTAQFALAIAYDRDEQITRSHEVLERLLSYDAGLNYALGQASYDYTGAGLDTEPLLVPPYERHYFMALRYEALNQLDDARAEWSAYVRAADDSPFRDRAEAHIEAIDELRGEQMATSKKRGRKPAGQPPIHILRGGGIP